MSPSRIRTVKLFQRHKHAADCPTLYGIIVSQATCLGEVPFSESRRSAEIECERQSVFSHLSPAAEIVEAGLLQTHCHAITTPYISAYWFYEVSILPLRILAGCPHSRFLHRQWTSLFVVWGTQWVPEMLRKFLFYLYLSPAKEELLLGKTKILAENPLSISIIHSNSFLCMSSVLGSAITGWSRPSFCFHWRGEAQMLAQTSCALWNQKPLQKDQVLLSSKQWLIATCYVFSQTNKVEFGRWKFLLITPGWELCSPHSLPIFQFLLNRCVQFS